MEKDTVLRLLYSGFTTQQLHQVYRQFGSLNYIKNKYASLITIKDEKLQLKLDTFEQTAVEPIYDALNKAGIQAVFCKDDCYPELLKEIYDYPLILFCKGDTELLKRPRKLAIVGGRERTAYTTHVLEQFIPELVAQNIVTVSGLAKGADSDAHVMTLLNNGQTIAVLGFGHHFHYPEETRLVRNYIEQEGLVISEYPPHVSPRAWQFPERNRIISGLSQSVLITEAKKRSGSLITCDQALDQNRNVYCLPGPITSVFSEGCNMRIAEGATLCMNVETILSDYASFDV